MIVQFAFITDSKKVRNLLFSKHLNKPKWMKIMKTSTTWTENLSTNIKIVPKFYFNYFQPTNLYDTSFVANPNVFAFVGSNFETLESACGADTFFGSTGDDFLDSIVKNYNQLSKLENYFLINKVKGFLFLGRGPWFSKKFQGESGLLYLFCVLLFLHFYWQVFENFPAGRFLIPLRVYMFSFSFGCIFEYVKSKL